MISVNPSWWQIFKKPYMKFQLQTERRVVEEFEGTNIEDSVEYAWIDIDNDDMNYLMSRFPIFRTYHTQSIEGECGLYGKFEIRKPFTKVTK